MIGKIRVCGVATYGFPGIELSDLKKINFLYGSNGCGKTTISNFLANPGDQKFGSCAITWDGGRPLKIVAYNKIFRERNFGTGNIAGVFTLGQATKEDLELIQSKKKELAGLIQENKEQNETLEKQNGILTGQLDKFTDECWAVFKKYESDFKEALRGSISAKILFRDKILSEQISNRSAVLPREKLKEKAGALLAGQPSRMASISKISFMEKIGEIEADSIWEKVVVGKSDVDVAGLIVKLGNSDWVNQGRQYLTDDEICPFCQENTISEKFRREIAGYFDESFEADRKLIQEKQANYIRYASSEVSVLDQIESSEKLNKDSKLDIEKYCAHLKALHSQISENKLLISEKLSKLSHRIELISTKDEFENISKLIDTANSAINNHNTLVDNRATEIANLKSEVWRFLLEEMSEKIKQYHEKSAGLERGIKGIGDKIRQREQSIRDLGKEIVDLSKNVTSVQPAVDEMNRMLGAYGFTGFKIVPSPDLDNYYAIQRENGALAHETLSEGEVTFITFLYFVQLAKGALDQNSVTDDRVLVIDDPISSLDSTVLYVVSTIVKDLIKIVKENTAGSIKQLLLLTHNVYFHKEVSFLGSRSNGDKDTHFWILRKNQNITSVQSYGQSNPIESSYELLWREIKEWQRNSGITLQNTMRRVIENYFKILGKFTDDGLVAKFTTVEEQQICRSLISWINDGSHTIPDDLYVQTPEDSAEKYLGVFENIFRHTNNEGHYKMMMGIEG